MSEEMKKKEEAVFEEEVNDEDLRQTAGGLFFDVDEDKTHCTNFHFRDTTTAISRTVPQRSKAEAIAGRTMPAIRTRSRIPT